MCSKLTLFLKAGLIAFYAIVPLAFFIEPLQAYSQIMLYVALALAVAHIGEYVLIKSKLAALPADSHFVKTLLFGFLHWLPLFQAQKAAN